MNSQWAKYLIGLVAAVTSGFIVIGIMSDTETADLYDRSGQSQQRIDISFDKKCENEEVDYEVRKTEVEHSLKWFFKSKPGFKPRGYFGNVVRILECENVQYIYAWLEDDKFQTAHSDLYQILPYLDRSFRSSDLLLRYIEDESLLIETNSALYSQSNLFDGLDQIDLKIRLISLLSVYSEDSENSETLNRWATIEGATDLVEAWRIPEEYLNSKHGNSVFKDKNDLINRIWKSAWTAIGFSTNPISMNFLDDQLAQVTNMTPQQFSKARSPDADAVLTSPDGEYAIPFSSLYLYRRVGEDGIEGIYRFSGYL
jgi:hypothetical protein